MSVLVSAALSPIFGPELATYKRLWYGVRGREFSGVTPGTFYDFSAFPIPYAPYQTTSWKLDIPSEYDGKILHVHVTRKNPSIAPRASDDIDIVATSPITIFDLYLSKGLNKVTVSYDGAAIVERAVTCLRAATLLYGFASNIYEGFWAKIDAVEADMFSEEPTVLTRPVVGFSDHFPTALNMYRHAHSMSVNALMNMPGSTAALQALSQALLRQTPVLSRPRLPLNRSWLLGLQTQAWSVNGRIMHVWAPDAASARYPGAVHLASTQDQQTGRDFVGAAETGDFSVLNTTTELEYEERRSWISLLGSVDVTEFEFWAHDKLYGIVQAPGLADTPTAFLDGTGTFDSGRHFDSFAEHGDLDQAPYVGTALVPDVSSTEPGLPMSMLDKSMEDFGVTLEKSAAFSYTDVLSWGVNSSEVVTSWNASSNEPTWSPVSGEAASAAPGLLVTVLDIGAGHVHAVVVFTFAQAAAIRLGTPWTGTTENSGSPIHLHTLSLSWDGQFVAVLGNNHGHLALVQEFAFDAV